ncbi:hypothetical protein IM793_03610 [Pedobacter sp. MR2016-19]|uniref:hypothetical protein n=1 Tax=Pedobacter sp. MR2016-19 TaxID=2780089 RepID=UPI001875BF4F|nr:hypothetical protein [Pedobacter sp. MR2016-19]MBE5318234.1 hypothetical protein [Pedobacter sp. MR2016-19]
MINNKKYASDRFLDPLIIVLFIITPIVYGFCDSKTPTLISAIICSALITGIQIYKSYKENNKKFAVYYLIGLLTMYLFVIIYN